MLKKLCPVAIILCVFSLCASAEIEKNYYNGRLVNIAPNQFKVLETMEKRLYNKTFDDKPTLERIEQLEADLMGDVQKGSAIARLNNLKIKSMHHAIRGTSIPPSMMKQYKTQYLNNENEGYYDDVGIIDGCIRLWFPEFYAQLSKYRMYKEAKGINDFNF
ncbi:hypothetical protein IKQ26_05945 [bacterium]|nr:hypothetical protein [bacterium]